MKKAAFCVLLAVATATAAFADDENRAPAPACQPVAQLPTGLVASQTMRLIATCLPADDHDGGPCRMTLRFLDADGSLLVNPDTSAPVALTTLIPVREAAALDLPGVVFVSLGTRRIVKAVVTATDRDFNADRIATSVEVFDAATERTDIRYSFQGCRTIPFAFVPRAQRPPDFRGTVQEMSFAPPGITIDEAVTLNAACTADPLRPDAPCRVVLRYSRFEDATSGPHAGADSLIDERDLTIAPGAIGSFGLAGSALGTTAAGRVLVRPSVVGHPDMLRRIVTSLEILDEASGIARTMNQPQIKIGRPVAVR